jgi:CheY-like chemotaxis protein
MVHGFVEQTGGRLVLKSRKAKGTTAELWLPVAPKSSVSAVSEEKLPLPVSPRRALTVLVVDDDSLVLTNMSAMLEDIGHRVFEADSARKALSILRREKQIDLVITDQAMPRMTGIELITAIKSERPGLATILATGYAELPPETDPLQLKLAKPFRQRELVHAVKQAMNEPTERRLVRFGAR